MKILLFSFLLSCCSALVSAQQPVDYVNPFIEIGRASCRERV